MFTLVQSIQVYGRQFSGDICKYRRGGAGGLWIMGSQRQKLGRVVHGAPVTTNLAFGGADWKTLYFTSRNHLGAVNVKIPGIPVPAGKR
jgi:sugar lactone lactonase YvrE